MIPNEILDDKGGDTQPWVPREVIPPQDQMDPGKAYSVGYSISPTIQKRLNGGKYILPCKIRRTWDLITTKVPEQSDGNSMALAIRDALTFPLNLIFTLDNGDIGFTSTGVMPKRKHNVVQGVYTKRGSKIENRWEGILTS